MTYLFNTFIYTDDTAVVMSDRDPVSLQIEINQAMGDLHAWFTANKLSLNASKSNLMFFGTHMQLLSTKNIVVEHGGHIMERVDTKTRTHACEVLGTISHEVVPTQEATRPQAMSE